MRRTSFFLLGIGAAAACAPPSSPPPAGTAAAADPPAAPAEAGFPTRPPQLAPPPPLTLPEPVRRTLANGMDVVYVRHGTLPVVHATLLTPGGAALDPAGTPGLAVFTADLLDAARVGAVHRQQRGLHRQDGQCRGRVLRRAPARP